MTVSGAVLQRLSVSFSPGAGFPPGAEPKPDLHARLAGAAEIHGRLALSPRPG
jgi:hypothetical protein